MATGSGMIPLGCETSGCMELTIVRYVWPEGKGTFVPKSDGKLLGVRYRSHATYSRQPRQVRKEATVTSSCVCSGFPVPGFFRLDSCISAKLERTAPSSRLSAGARVTSEAD